MDYIFKFNDNVTYSLQSEKIGNLTPVGGPV